MPNKDKNQKNKHKMDNGTGKTGISIPPTDLSQQSLPSESTTLSANTPAFVPMSNILNQTRSVLYPPAPIYPVVTNFQASGLSEQNNQNNQNVLYTTGMSHDTFHSSSQSGDPSCQQQQCTNFIHTNAPSTNAIAGASPQNIQKPHNAANVIPGAPQWVSHMMQSLDVRLGHIEKELVNQNTKWQNVDMTLQNQNARMLNIEQQVTEINRMKQNMANLQISVDATDKEVRSIALKVQEYDTSIDTYSSMCDDVQSNLRYSKEEIDHLYNKVEKLESEQKELKETVQKSENTIIDLQCRSMRDNLIFTGITEPDSIEGSFEDTEDTLCDFLKREMKIETPISFHRVHRINSSERNDSPRPIVAKFEHFKDRELVRTAAPKTLKDKPYGVREQFPKVIEERRKNLYPVMKQARRNKENKVRLVRDKLYINNVEYKQNHERSAQRNANPHTFVRRSNFRSRGSYRNNELNQENSSSRDNNINTNNAYTKSRVYQRSSYKNVQHQAYQRPAKQGDAAKTLNFSVPTVNRFSGLVHHGGNVSDRDSDSRKHKASSPLDADKTLKKHREHENTDSTISDESELEIDIEIDNSPQCDPPNVQTRTISDTQVSFIEMPKNKEIPATLALNRGPVLTADSNNNRDVMENQSSNEA